MGGSMMKRRDHVSRQKLINRIGRTPTDDDLYNGRRYTIKAPFHPWFDEFAARVAFAMRRIVIYRTDGGRMARGLVRVSGDLEKVHDFLFRNKVSNGQAVHLEAVVYRRNTSQATSRWIMTIKFELPTSLADFSKGDTITSNPRERADALFTQADAVAKRIGGEKGRRIRAYLDYADDLSLQQLKDLWCYRAESVAHFVKSSKDRQQELIDAGGDFPLIGKLPGKFQTPYRWRRYPFRDLLDSDLRGALHSEERLRTALGAIDEYVTDSIKVTNASSMLQSKRATSEHVTALREHLAELMGDKKTLYYHWNKNTKDSRSFLQKYG